MIVSVRVHVLCQISSVLLLHQSWSAGRRPSGGTETHTDHTCGETSFCERGTYILLVYETKCVCVCVCVCGHLAGCVAGGGRCLKAGLL